MRRPGGLSLVTTLLAGVFLLIPPRPSAADVGPPQNPHFPKPVALTPNVAFWKQVYTEHGVGDFVLHDRDNLGVIYDVVRVPEKASQTRAEQLAKPELDRARGKYRDTLLQLADGVAPDDLGAEGRRVAELWGWPCQPDRLRRAAENIRVQQGLRQKVNEGLQRAQKLLPQMVTILKRHDVPPELAALPLVESTFNPAARSKAGAVGLWQFIRSTGKRYLTITRKRDDRRDPLRATEAAAHLLKNSYNSLGSWPLAIVAYNHGHAGIQAASEAVGSKDIEDIVARYNGPRFGFASKNFYAEFLAALDVVHPLLGDRGKPLDARGRRRSVQQASVPVQPPITATLSPLPAPAETPQAVETPAPADVAPPVEAPVGSDQASLAPDLAAPPAALPSESSPVPLLPAGDAPAPDAEASEVPGHERSAAVTDIPAPPAPADSQTAPPPSIDEGAQGHDAPGPEVEGPRPSDPAPF